MKSGENKTFLEYTCDIVVSCWLVGWFFSMRLELCIYCIIEVKKTCRKKVKVIVKTDITARVMCVTKQRLGCHGTRYQRTWASQDGIRADFPEEVTSETRLTAEPRGTPTHCPTKLRTQSPHTPTSLLYRWRS